MTVEVQGQAGVAAQAHDGEDQLPSCPRANAV